MWNWFKKKKKEDKIIPQVKVEEESIGMEKEVMNVRKDTRVTKEDIKNLFYISMVNYIEEMKREIQSYVMPKELRKQYETLRNLGFSSVASMRDLVILNDKEKEITDAKKKQQEFLKMIDILTDDFYGKTIIVKENDFRKIIEDNGLWCGSFSDYIGDLNLENLYEIDKIFKIVRNCYPITKFNFLKLGTVHLEGGEIVDEVAYRQLYRIPLLARTGSRFLSRYDIPGLVNSTVGEIFNGSYIHIDYEEVNTNLFIAAPAKYMKNADKNCKAFYNQEPFICSFCDFGILVHSDWGKEVIEDMKDKQKELSDLI